MSLIALEGGELDAAERALLAEGGDALARVMFSLSLGLPTDDEDAKAHARSLGWLDERDRFTVLGNLVKDPLREFVCWEERERQLPSQNQSPVLQPVRFAGRAVLEVGSGGGCNLLSLGRLPRRLVGVEPMPVYRQLQGVLAAKAGLPNPEVVEGWGRQLPFDDGSFDIVLCYSSHQYMEVDVAIREMARVLRPAGRLLMIGNTLYPFGGETVVRFATGRSLGTLKYDLTAILNTVTYQASGRRIVSGRGGTTTTGVPIYPTRRHIHRALRATGLEPCLHDERTLATGETLFVATRR